jgi:hypothetical protein
MWDRRALPNEESEVVAVQFGSEAACDLIAELAVIIEQSVIYIC